MFIIKTYVDNSNISGKGVFAGENIKKGKIVWVFNPNVDLCLPKKKFKYLSKEMQKKISIISYDKDEIYIIPKDNDRYSNHSSIPNLIEDINDTNSFTKCLIACKDIFIGDELTQNYKTFMSEEEFKIKTPGEIK